MTDTQEAPERIWADRDSMEWVEVHPDMKQRRTEQEYIRADLARATPEAVARAVRVKALEWEYDAGNMEWVAYAVTDPHVIRQILPCDEYPAGGFDWSGQAEDCDLFSSLEAAKSAAQADYTARILSALEPAPVQGWRTDMENAPKDTQILLGWWRKWPSVSWETEAEVYHDTRGGSLHGQATHWMPLPPAPHDGGQG